MISLYRKHAGLSSEAMIVSPAVAARSGMLHTPTPGFCAAIVPPPPPDIPGRMQGFTKGGAPWHMDGTIYMQLPAGLIPFF